jgi:hypothetical protein
MRSGGGAGENMLRRSVRMRKKFSDLGAWRLRRTALGAEPPAGGGALRAREEEVVEKRREVVVAAGVMVAAVVFRERRESRLKSPVMDVEEAILKVLEICDASNWLLVASPAEECDSWYRLGRFEFSRYIQVLCVVVVALQCQS